MDSKSLKDIRALTRLSDYFIKHDMRSVQFQDIAVACMDRAILLPDIHPSVLRDTFTLSEEQMDQIRVVSNAISFELEHEAHVPGRHIRLHSRPRHEFETFNEYARSFKPVNWSWAEFACAIPNPTGSILAEALQSIFREEEGHNRSLDAWARCRTYIPEPHKVWHRFEDRVAASGLGFGSLESAGKIDQTHSNKSFIVRDTAKDTPINRIKRIKSASAATVVHHESRVPWSFVSQVMREARFRTQAKSIVGSWKSQASAFNAWSLFMGAVAPHAVEFPIDIDKLGAFMTCLVNPGTLRQYVNHLRNAHRLVGLSPFDGNMVPALIRGAHKGGEQYKPKRSFLTAEVLKKIIHRLRAQNLPGDQDLIRVLQVGYTFQLRAHSELFLIARNSRNRSHLYTVVTESEVNGIPVATLTLSRRKNRQFECKIIRACWCAVDTDLCGTCTLLSLARQSSDDSSFLFSQQKSAMIQRLKSVSASLSVHATWHGLRRGRTVDLIRMRDSRGRPVASLQEVFDSGQWGEGSRALLSYVQSEDVDASRIVIMYADNSDSE